jgi:membrane fusion protein, multidrug efflux system
MMRNIGKSMRSHILRVTILGLWSLLLLVGCGGGQGQEEPEEDDAVSVRTLEVTPGTFYEVGEYYGTATGIEEARLISVSGGRVNQILAQVGDQVEAGQPLARIDADKAQSQYETAILQERIAREDLDRQRRFLEMGNTPQVAVDQAELAWRQARTNVLEARRVLDGALAISPVDGEVVAKHIDLYDELAPGQPTFTVADLSRMKVVVGVPEGDIAGIDSLGAAEVRFQSFPGHVWTAEATSFSRKRSNNTLSFDVELVLDNEERILLSGLTATVRLVLRELEDRIVIPSEAVISQGRNSYVMIANSTTARRIPVTLGPSNTEQTVIAAGLAPGDEVIVEGINQVSDGTQVRTVE